MGREREVTEPLCSCHAAQGCTLVHVLEPLLLTAHANSHCVPRLLAVLCNCPERFTVKDSRGDISARCCVDM